MDNCHRKIYTNRIFLQKHIDRSNDRYVLRDPCHELFCVFKIFYAAGTKDTEEVQGYDSISIVSAFSCSDGDVFKNIRIRLEGT